MRSKQYAATVLVGLEVLLWCCTAWGSPPAPADSTGKSDCRVALTPENAQLAYDAFKGASAGDGCELEAVTTEQIISQVIDKIPVP